MSELADRWRAARPVVAGLHLDSAACSRQSFGALGAAAAHARREAEIGGYVAAEEAAPVLDAGRAAFAALAGVAAPGVVFTTGSLHALDLLLGSWPAAARTVACLPGEYGPNLAVLANHGFTRRTLPVDGTGRLDLDVAAAVLAVDPPGLVHLTALASHRGLVQPLAATARLCADLGLPLVVDAAQALGQIDCAVGTVGEVAVYSSSRKWIAGPRGIGALAVAPPLMRRLHSRLPQLSVLRSLEFGEANVAARIGFSVALGEYMAHGPQAVRARLAEVGRLTRTALAELSGWRVAEPLDEPSAITTLAPTGGADPEAVRAFLIRERRIVTTAATAQRAPLEMTGPVLRISPHVDTTADDLADFADALAAATTTTAARGG